jgi:catechol 2,3-dioxygenase-like lactoylglutathione lyase family enzyme
MADAVLVGIHHLKLPVSSLSRSLPWYQKVLGFTVELEFPDDDGVVRGVAGSIPGVDGTGFALRENPGAARGFAGFDPIAFGIADEAAAHAWVARLDDLGIEHSPVIEATIGWIVSFHDPDGIELRLYSFARHGNDHSDHPGSGRRPTLRRG